MCDLENLWKCVSHTNSGPGECVCVCGGGGGGGFGPQGGDILDLILYYIYILTLSLKPICFQQFLFNSMCFQQVYLYIQCIFNNLISAFIAKFNVFSTLLFLF